MEELLYNSTRGGEVGKTASQAIIKGLASDGGLFVPSSIPKMIKPLESLLKLNYQQIAYEIMKLYLTDFTEDELKNCIHNAYDEKFDTKDIAPIVKRGDSYYLELFHGATIAFKDIALSILPHLMMTAAKKQHINKDIVILTATSGDTGKAALDGFADVEGTRIIVFYPRDGVSPIQKHQMITQKGINTYVVGIDGNFDDAQNGVKDIFNDKVFQELMHENGYQFSSANSINIGRLIPQVVYYFYAYTRMVNNQEIKLGEKINFVVPTGNFGNILAGFYAKNMGLPINKLICASNDNKVLYDFINTGVYDKKRDFILTISPSMDILISSNLERLIFNLTNNNSVETKELMEELVSKNSYEISEEMKDRLKDFYGNFATIDETHQAIKNVFDTTNYLIDPHTAVACSVYNKYKDQTGDMTKSIIIATASPYKFTRTVMKAIDSAYDKYTDFELISKMLDHSNIDIPEAIIQILDAKVLHTKTCSVKEMKEMVSKYLNLKSSR